MSRTVACWTHAQVHLTRHCEQGQTQFLVCLKIGRCKLHLEACYQRREVARLSWARMIGSADSKLVADYNCLGGDGHSLSQAGSVDRGVAHTDTVPQAELASSSAEGFVEDKIAADSPAADTYIGMSSGATVDLRSATEAWKFDHGC